MPSLDPKAHRTNLLQQLAAIAQQVEARAGTARDELAKREIIAVRPAANAQLTPDQLDDTRADARLVGVMPETGTVVLDVANADLEYLRRKLDAFADDANAKTEIENDGTVTTHRDKERAIAPVGSIGLAELEDLGGAQLRAEALPDDRPYWFEIGCRGGYRNPLEDTSGSRAQIARQLHRLGVHQKLDEFLGPEQVYFFVRVTRAQLDALRAATDCIFEVELAPQPLRDLKLFDDVSTKDLADFALSPPHDDRWRGKMSALVGDKLIAIIPVLGWWDQRKPLRTQEMRFSLLVSVFGPGVYAAIKPRIEAETAITIDV